jgi:methylmalonyl-CoA mutase N-terminal domain/subunit
MLRFHTQTAGVQLTAQQPEVNMVRVAVQALAAVLGGTQSLHTNSYDEAIALPTEKAARLAVRTQQVMAHETDLTTTVDPFAGSYAIESMTDDIESAAGELMDRVEELGGAVAAIEKGYQKAEIERSAYEVAKEIDAGERIVVGVNKFRIEGDEIYEPLRVDPALEAAQAARLAELRRQRDNDEVGRRLDELRRVAEKAGAQAQVGAVGAVGAVAQGDGNVGNGNVLYPLKDALRGRATVGEVCNALRDVWGAYVPPDAY